MKPEVYKRRRTKRFNALRKRGTKIIREIERYEDKIDMLHLKYTLLEDKIAELYKGGDV